MEGSRPRILGGGGGGSLEGTRGRAVGTSEGGIRGRIVGISFDPGGRGDVDFRRVGRILTETPGGGMYS